MNKLFKITDHTVIGGIILAVILAIFSYFITIEKLLKWIKVAFQDVELILNYEIAIWEIFLTIVVLLALKYSFIHFTKLKTAQESIIETTMESVEEIPTETRLTEDEEIILSIFMYDNSSLNIVEITNKNAVFSTKVFNQLRLDQLIEWLTNKNFLEPHFNYVSGTTYSLTRAGRDYILAHLMQE